MPTWNCCRSALTEQKNTKIGDRRLSQAKNLYQVGLLTAEGLKKAQSAGSLGVVRERHRRSNFHEDTL